MFPLSVGDLYLTEVPWLKGCIMDTNTFLELLRSLSQLTSLQLERAHEHINYHLRQDLLTQVLTEQHQQRPHCPRCHANHVIHWGQSRGVLRYRCKKCGRTFNQLHNTVLKGLRHKEQWVCYAQCLAEGASLRTAATACHINLKTAFRWRHRFLRYALTTKATQLRGIIEADEVFTPESFKGKRKMPRSPRKHGSRGHGHIPMVPTLIALDRYGHEADEVLLSNTYQQLEPILLPLLSKGSILCTDGNHSYIRIAEHSAGIIHKRLITSQKRVEEGVYHTQTLNNYVSRWREWMRRFHGVGTAYLTNYLAWFRVINVEKNTVRSWLRGGLLSITNT